MKLRMSWIAIIFITAISLGVSLSNSSLLAEGNESELRVAKAIASTDQENRLKLRKDQIFEMSKDFESGERNAEFIQAELNSVTGDTAPIQWDGKKIKGRYKLTQILSHIHNLENGFELLFVHALTDSDQHEDTVTHYTERINEADEKNISSSFVFSKYIENSHGRPSFDPKTRAQYFFSLKSDVFKNSFNLRQPEGTFEISEAKTDSFDPLAILNAENGNFNEISDYQYELQAGQTLYVVNVTPRITELETLTIEIDIREINSLTTSSFVLVYEGL